MPVLRRLLPVVASALAGVLACARQPATQGPCATLPTTPTWTPDAAGIAAVLDYAENRVRYEDAAHPTGERRPLAALTQRGNQPTGNRYRLANQPQQGTARWGIAPATCAHRYPLSRLGSGTSADGVGDIVGVIYADAAYLKPTSSAPGPAPDCRAPSAQCRLRIPKDTSYVWVDSLSGGAARAWIIPKRATSRSDLVEIPVAYEANPPGSGPRGFAEARWLFDPADDDGWVSCVETGCCRLDL